MAPNSLSPASGKIDYHTLYATHHAVLPTLAWFPTSITGDLGSYQAWDLSSIDAEDMWTGLLAVLAPLVPSTTVFDAVTVYTQADAMAPNIPQASHAYAVAGTSGATGLSEANSATFNFKTTGNANAKVVLLDFPLGSGGYNAIHPAGFSAEILALAAYIESTANAFSGRDDNRVNVLRKVTFDLNDKLQKQYRMGA
jgi:hypothetical protein